MRSVQTDGSTHAQRSRTSPACLALAGTVAGWSSVESGHPASIFLHPFAPPALPGFLATMGALTPGRPALRILIRDNEHRLCFRPGLPASCHRTFRSFRLQPPAAAPTSFLGFLRRAYRTTSPRPPLLGSRASLGLRLCPAGSPRQPAESSSLSLRTGRSPPVALHPASRRRSYLRLQAGERIPGEDLHLSDQTHLQTHWGHVSNVPEEARAQPRTPGTCFPALLNASVAPHPSAVPCSPGTLPSPQHRTGPAKTR